MQHELVSLERRISSLEDSELEVMERLEEAQTSLDSFTAQLGAADEQLTALAKARDEKGVDLQVTMTALVEKRAEAASGMPQDLMKLYEHLRVQRGVGAAALKGRQCTGCQMAINASDLAVIAKAPVDEVVRCEECSRILVRTSESGL
jgi:predicted  nucleic acid-binding Zn-ribbon protein